MEKRVYKGRLLTAIKEVVLLFFAAAALVLILGRFLNLKYVLGIAAVLVILFIFLIINDMRISVTMTDHSITFRKAGREDHYIIEQCGFRARDDNGNFYLHVIDSAGGEHKYDLSMLGYGQFRRIIEDIGIVGDKAKPIELKAKGE